MRESIEMSRKVFYSIVGICAVIIMLTSMDMLFRTKDIEMFNMWLNSGNFTEEFLSQSNEQLFSTYLQMCIGMFIIRVITPVSLAIHAYFTLVKSAINKMYVIVWSVIISGATALLILGESTFSVFYIGSLIGHIVLVIIMLYLGKCINDIKGI